MSTEDGEGGDMTVALGGFLLHFGQNIADDFSVVILGDVEELRPRQNMVEIVLHLIILREAEQIACLHRQQIVHCRLPDAHHCWIKLLDAVAKGIRVLILILGEQAAKLEVACIGCLVRR